MTYYFNWNLSLLIKNGLNLLLLFIWCWVQHLWRMECLRKHFLFFLFFHIRNNCSTFSMFFKLMFIFSVYTSFTYFHFDYVAWQFLDVICLNLLKLRSFHIFSSRLCCLAISWYDMFENIRIMFVFDWIWSRYVWTNWFLLCCRSEKLLINQLLFSFSAGHVYRFVHLL